MIELTAVNPRSDGREYDVVRVESQTLVESRFTSYLSDESGLGPGHAQTMFLPSTEKQVADFLREMNNRKMPTTISGGRTGIVGGAVPEGGAVLSLDGMNRIIGVSWDKPTGEWRVTVEPGIRLRELQERIARKNLANDTVSQSDPNWKDLPKFQKEAQQYFYPPDPTENEASLGGTVATDASGARTYHFGRTRKHVRAIRVALASGDIFEIRRSMIVDSSKTVRLRCLDGSDRIFQIPSYESPHLKTSAGYLCHENMDLIDFFIGSEGTLGVITSIEIALAIAPKETAMFLAFFPSRNDALRFVMKMRSQTTLEHHLTVFSLEYFDSNCIALLRKLKLEGKLGIGITLPSDESAAAILCEFSYHDLPQAIHSLQEPLEESGSSLDTAISGAEEQSRQHLRELRHAVPEAINRIVSERKQQIPGMHKIGTDTAVSDQKLELLMKSYSELLGASNLEYYVFGHIAENHLHVNLLPRTSEELTAGERLAEELAKQAVRLGGTVSAEHGIGKLKRHLLGIMFTDTEINQMRAAKRALDPNLILCSGNIFL